MMLIGNKGLVDLLCVICCELDDMVKMQKCIGEFCDLCSGVVKIVIEFKLVKLCVGELCVVLCVFGLLLCQMVEDFVKFECMVMDLMVV